MPIFRAAHCSAVSPSSRIFQAITVFFYFCCLLAFSWSFVNPDEALKIFTFSAMLSIIVSGGSFQLLLANKRLLILPVSILLLGLLQIIWVSIFKQPQSPFLGAYRAYQSTGKALIFSAFVMAAIMSRPPSSPAISKIINGFIIFLAFGLYSWISYKYNGMSDVSAIRYRTSLGFQPATGTAYALTLVALLAAQALLNFRKNITIILFFIHFAFSYFAITLTQTRAAILLYPLLSISLFLLHYRHDRNILLRASITFLVLGLIALLPLKSVLEKRYADFQTDMRAYNNDNSKTSIGSRFAMQHAGIIAGKTDPLGQSLEQRSTTIKAAAKEDPSLRGAVKYLNTHLHNELIDTFSLKGILGVILLLSFYTATIYIAFLQRNIGLFIVVAAVAIYGLSDLLLYAKSGSLNSMLALCIAVMLMPGTSRESAHDQKV